MAEIKTPSKAKLFSGIIFSDDGHIKTAEENLERLYGRIDKRSPVIDFAHTEYYAKMGTNLKKIFLSFENLIERDQISSIKQNTNRIENEISGGARIINIDPGYLTMSNVFLASCKEYYHRIYVGGGIYLENEYYWTKGRYEFFEWTYPDYKTREYVDFFTGLRGVYRTQIASPTTKD